MKKIVLFLLFIVILTMPLFSQEVIAKISGVVKDATTGDPLPGASIMIIGSFTGTVTNLDGYFELDIGLGASIEISYVGFRSKSLSISTSRFFEIFLEPQVHVMDELVIVGAAMRKTDLTGAVVSISAETLQEVPTSSVIQALQGKVPGIFIQSNAAPGARAQIRIRGHNSIQFGTNPIFVVDGLVMEGGLEMLNPDDIASITVLKDASATAIYGSRGANGVIVITTKRGEKGRLNISYDSWVGFQEFSKEMPLMRGDQLFDLRVDAYANSFIDRFPLRNREHHINNNLATMNPVRNRIFSSEELESYANQVTYNWLDAIVQRGFQQNHAVSFSGGSTDGSYFLSFNYNDQTGQLRNSGYTRYSGKINLDQNVKSWLKVSSSNTFIYTAENPVANGNMFLTTLRASPLLPISEEYWYMREGKVDNQSANNPLRDLKVTRDLFNGRLLSSNFVNISPIPDLNFRSTYSFDLQNTQDFTYFPTTSTQSFRAALDGQSVLINSKNFNWQWDNTVTYQRIFAGVHRISLLAGTNRSFFRFNYNQQNASGYNNDLFSYFNPQGASDRDNFYLSGNFVSHSIASYLARISYSYKARYHLTVTGRFDGSSKFGPKNKWGFFPSIAGSWNISEERFMADHSWINNLRLRAGFGIAGNQNIPNYGYMTLYHPTISLGSNILRNYGGYGNPELRWEEQSQLNLGLDAGFFNDRIIMSMDIFHINNDDLLMERSMAVSSGYLSKIDNVGALENRGIEIALDLVPVVIGDFSWNIGLNIASDRNKITRLYDDVDVIYNIGGWSHNEIQRTGNLFLGQSLNTIYVLGFNRIIQEEDLDYINSLQMGGRITRPGDVLPLDKDGNGIINDRDRFIVGTMDPYFYGGISTGFQYRGFAVQLNSHFSYGARRISYLYETLMSSIGNSGAHIDLLNRWTPDNTETNIPRAFSDGGRYNLHETDWAVQDASFWRLSQVSLSYTIPSTWARSIGTERIRVYITGTNLITITTYKGFDPDSGDWYPSSKMFVTGINVTI